MLFGLVGRVGVEWFIVVLVWFGWCGDRLCLCSLVNVCGEVILWIRCRLMYSMVGVLFDLGMMMWVFYSLLYRVWGVGVMEWFCCGL